MTRCRLLHRGLVHFRSGGGKLSFLGKSMMAGQQLLHRACFFSALGLTDLCIGIFWAPGQRLGWQERAGGKKGSLLKGWGGEACKRGAKGRKGEVGQNPVQSVSTKKVSIDISFLPS